MARFARVVIEDVPHHVTQRGNARQIIFSSDEDRLTYLDLLRRYSELHGLSLLGYCQMSNHVHLIAIPRSSQSMAQALKHAHGENRGQTGRSPFSPPVLGILRSRGT